MCISNIKPIKRKSGFGYAIREQINDELFSPCKATKSPLNEWLKAEDKSYYKDAKTEQACFHFFTNKKSALKFKNNVFSGMVLVRLQYRGGLVSGETDRIISFAGNPNGIPCSTAKEIKVLEIL